MKEELVHEYKGYEYCPWDDREPDVIKTFHEVITPAGDTIMADFSPYMFLDKETFAAWVDAGCPNRGNRVGPLHGVEDFTNV